MAPSSAGRSSATTSSSRPDPDAGQPVEVAPASIPTEERVKLWVRLAGRCAICNDYLLENEFTGHVLNLGEMAHNVGRGRSERSGELSADQGRHRTPRRATRVESWRGDSQPAWSLRPLFRDQDRLCAVAAQVFAKRALSLLD
jgi:hypothetical protein